MSHRLAPSRTLGLAVAALALGAAAAPPARAATLPPQSEYFARPDGLDSALPLDSAYVEGGDVSADGRSVYYKLSSAPTAPDAQRPGLYRRTIDTGRTTLIDAGVDTRFADLTDDGTLMSFNTKSKLSSADGNSSWDLYTYNALTGAIDLVSRKNGVGGGAIGLRSPGVVARDGRSAVFGTSDGISRRDLLAGTTVKVAGTSSSDRLMGSLYFDYQHIAHNVSPDGRSLVLTPGAGQPAKLVTPAGVATLTGAPASSNDGSYVADSGGGFAFNASSTKLAYIVGNTELRVRDLATGAETRTPIFAGNPDVVYSYVRLHSFGPNDTSVRYVIEPTAFPTADQNPRAGLYAVSLGTGLQANLGLWSYDRVPDVISRSGRFGLQDEWVLGASNVSLPGTVELPPLGRWFRMERGCKASGWPFNMPAKDPSLQIPYPDQLPAGQTVTAKVFDAAGQPLSAGAFWTYPTKSQAWSFEVVATYPDGRSQRRTYPVPAPATCPWSISS